MTNVTVETKLGGNKLPPTWHDEFGAGSYRVVFKTTQTQRQKPAPIGEIHDRPGHVIGYLVLPASLAMDDNSLDTFMAQRAQASGKFATRVFDHKSKFPTYEVKPRTV